MREGYAAAGIDLTVAEIRVLKSVAHTTGCTAQTVAERMLQDKGRIARLIKSLVADDLVVRQPHPKDNRSRCLLLTANGRALVQRIALIEAEAGERMAAGLGADQIRDFVHLADAMSANLEHQDPA